MSKLLASLAPAEIDDEYNSSPERDSRLTTQQKIAEAKRAERQDALFQSPTGSTSTQPRNPFEKLVKAFTPVEVDRDGNPVDVVEPPKEDDRDVGEKLFGLVNAFPFQPTPLGPSLN